MKQNIHLQNSLNGLNQKPIAVYSVYVKLTNGDHATAFALSQIIYWGQTMGRRFWKKDSELADEICATTKQMRRIKTALKKLSFLKITIRRAQGLAQTHYEIDFPLLARELDNLHSLEQKTPLEVINDTELTQIGQNELSRMGQIGLAQIEHSYTENTTEITTKNSILYNYYNSSLEKTKKDSNISNDESKECLKLIHDSPDRFWFNTINNMAIKHKTSFEETFNRYWSTNKKLREWHSKESLKLITPDYQPTGETKSGRWQNTKHSQKATPKEKIALACGYTPEGWLRSDAVDWMMRNGHTTTPYAEEQLEWYKDALEEHHSKAKRQEILSKISMLTESLKTQQQSEKVINEVFDTDWASMSQAERKAELERRQAIQKQQYFEDRCKVNETLSNSSESIITNTCEDIWDELIKNSSTSNKNSDLSGNNIILASNSTKEAEIEKLSQEKERLLNTLEKVTNQHKTACEISQSPEADAKKKYEALGIMHNLSTQCTNIKNQISSIDSKMASLVAGVSKSDFAYANVAEIR